MIRKKIAAALTLFIMFGAIFVTAQAAMYMSADKKNYACGERITVTVDYADYEHIYNRAGVALSKPGQAINQYISFTELDQTGKNVLTIKSPDTAGSYELRLLSYNGDFPSDATLLMRLPITVAKPPRSAMHLVMEQTSYNIGNPVKGSVKGITQAEGGYTWRRCLRYGQCDQKRDFNGVE
jgi:hypothetical protein